jgi:ProQ/FINO family
MNGAELRRRFPLAFNDERKPLMRGVHHYMHPRLRDALRAWVQHPDYLHNITIPGAIRVDLDGRPAGEVTEAERQWTLCRPIIPMRESAIVEAEARARGSGEKIATTTITGLNIDGIDIRSRYNKAHEYEVLRDAVLRLAPEKRELVSYIHCDSQASWVINVTLRAWNVSLAEHIGFVLSEALLYLNGGHNGITLTCNDDHLEIPAEWNEEELR